MISQSFVCEISVSLKYTLKVIIKSENGWVNKIFDLYCLLAAFKKLNFLSKDGIVQSHCFSLLQMFLN